MLNLVHIQGGAAYLKLYEQLRAGPSVDAWVAPEFVLGRDGRGTRSWKTPDVHYGAGPGLMVRGDLTSSLCEGFRELVEPLPMTVEGCAWTFMHFVGTRATLDEKRSDWSPPPLPHPYQRYWMIRRAVLQDAPQLYSAFFTIEGTGDSGLYCGAGFRKRVLEMQLVGLSFKQAGYFHREGDPEPPPPEPWPPAPRAVEIPPSKWVASVPSASTLLLLSTADERMRASLGLDAAGFDDKGTLAVLTKHLAALRPGYRKLRASERQGLLLGLAAVYGDLFVQRLGWRWRELTAGAESLLAVATPDDSHFIAVSAYMDSLLKHGQRDITLTLQFNMARAQLLPPSKPGGLVEMR